MNSQSTTSDAGRTSAPVQDGERADEANLIAYPHDVIISKHQLMNRGE
jgi:hypothetical protein